MSNNIWDEFDKAIDTSALADDVKNSASGEYKTVPHGEYEVSIEKMELVATKETKKPMLSIWFKVLSEGAYKGSFIFYNQVVEQAFQVHIANEFLRSLDSGLDVEFKTYKQYGNLILDIHEAISGKLEYALKFSEGKKGFHKYEITEVYEIEG